MMQLSWSWKYIISFGKIKGSFAEDLFNKCCGNQARTKIYRITNPTKNIDSTQAFHSDNFKT